MTTSLFTSLDDARSHLDGTLDWEWEAPASHDDFVRWAYQHQRDFEARDEYEQRVFDTNGALRAYLRELGQDPAAYSL